jgi:hypothetical protein
MWMSLLLPNPSFAIFAFFAVNRLFGPLENRPQVLAFSCQVFVMSDVSHFSHEMRFARSPPRGHRLLDVGESLSARPALRKAAWHGRDLCHIVAGLVFLDDDARLHTDPIEQCYNARKPLRSLPFSPKGLNVTAQGNALGRCRASPISSPEWALQAVPPFQGLKTTGKPYRGTLAISQGDALGWYVPAFQADGYRTNNFLWR